jgi:hypothetical protein
MKMAYKLDAASMIANAMAAQNQNYATQQALYGNRKPDNQPNPSTNTLSSNGVADRLYAILRDSYNNSLAANQTQYDNSVKAMKAAYNSGKTSVNNAAKEALREAYINQMQAQKAMPQQLSALGINGGMSESTAASLANNYASNRNAIETSRMAELGVLNDTLLQNMYAAANQLAQQNAAVNQSYYQQLAEQAMAGASPNVQTQAYDYRTDPAFIAQIADIISNNKTRDDVAARFQDLANKYGLAGAQALLSAAL